MANFTSFYLKYKEKLFGYLWRLSGNADLAGDLLQESFTRYMEKYRHRQPSAALLFTIARNAFYDHQRINRRNEPLSAETIDGAHGAENRYLVQERYQRLQQALQQLKPDEKEIMAMIGADTFTYREIAAIMKISEANVKVKVHRSRLKLKQLLQ